jgi:hypothetical protein
LRGLKRSLGRSREGGERGQVFSCSSRRKMNIERQSETRSKGGVSAQKSGAEGREEREREEEEKESFRRMRRKKGIAKRGQGLEL